MKRAQLLTAATILITCGCTESSLEPSSAVGRYPPEPVVITGTIVANASVSPFQVYLRVGFGQRVDIVGTEALRLAKLDGAQVQLRGTWTTTTSSPPYDNDVVIDPVRTVFAVAQFLVLAVGGREAMDGVLAQTDGRYYLQLTNGDVFWFVDLPSELAANLGKRVWVTGSMDRPPLMYGLID